MPRTGTIEAHWNDAYLSKGETGVSWFQRQPTVSLGLIAAYAAQPTTSIIDVGGGASRLVDELLSRGYSDLTVLDIAASGLEKAKRLGPLAGQIEWIVADVTAWRPERVWQLWHDRATFHFLTATTDQDAYIQALVRGTVPGSTVIISTFALVRGHAQTGWTKFRPLTAGERSYPGADRGTLGLQPAISQWPGTWASQSDGNHAL